MVKSGRLVRLNVHMTDLPGSLAVVTRILGECNANIDEVHHQRTFTTLPVQSAEVEFSLKTRDHQHIEDIILALSDHGFSASKV